MTEQRRPVRHARTELVLRLAGGGLLFATGAIHLDLYLTGYRSIPTIGWLFLLQVIAAFGLGAVVLATGGWLAAAAGAGFALSTLGGYLLSLWIGLFGFTEVRTTAGIVAGVIEVAAFAALAGLAGLAARQPGSRGLRAGVPGTGVVAASVAAVSVAALAGRGGSGPCARPCRRTRGRGRPPGGRARESARRALRCAPWYRDCGAGHLHAGEPVAVVVPQRRGVPQHGGDHRERAPGDRQRPAG